jgi:G protein-coupled receptor GPR1
MPSIPVTDFGEESIRTLGHVVRKAFKLVVTGTSQYITSSGSWQASGTSQYAALEARSSSLGANPNFNAGSILLQQQRFQLQIIAATFASVSVLATICALYWFMMMRRNFRRDLVLLLVAGDFWKSSWFVITASTKLSGIDVGTNTTLCQASGYFLQTGIESCGECSRTRRKIVCLNSC